VDLGALTTARASEFESVGAGCVDSLEGYDRESYNSQV